MKQQYTLDEIKEAFWETFHESGEWFFVTESRGIYSERDTNESTMEHFEDFVQALTKLEWNDVDKLLEKYKLWNDYSLIK